MDGEKEKMKRKACQECRIFVKGSECPLCKSTDLTTNWKGRMIIFNSDKSKIAEKLGIKSKGEYVIKTR